MHPFVTSAVPPAELLMSHLYFFRVPGLMSSIFNHSSSSLYRHILPFIVFKNSIFLRPLPGFALEINYHWNRAPPGAMKPMDSPTDRPAKQRVQLETIIGRAARERPWGSSGAVTAQNDGPAAESRHSSRGTAGSEGGTG